VTLSLTKSKEGDITEQAVNYDDVKRYRLDPDREQELVKTGGQRDKDNAFTSGIDPDMFIRFLDTPGRVVLEFTPEMSIPFDGDKMAEGTAEAYAKFAAEDAQA
jgi:hypothetical protein